MQMKAKVWSVCPHLLQHDVDKLIKLDTGLSLTEYLNRLSLSNSVHPTSHHPSGILLSFSSLVKAWQQLVTKNKNKINKKTKNKQTISNYPNHYFTSVYNSNKYFWQAHTQFRVRMKLVKWSIYENLIVAFRKLGCGPPTCRDWLGLGPLNYCMIITVYFFSYSV